MMTMVCLSDDGTYKVEALVAGNVIIVTTILTVIGLMVHLGRKMHLFIIKHRAPVLALAQSMLFLITILAPYGVELAAYLGYAWSADHVVVQRRIIKAAYLACRTLCYLVFLLR